MQGLHASHHEGGGQVLGSAQTIRLPQQLLTHLSSHVHTSACPALGKVWCTGRALQNKESVATVWRLKMEEGLWQALLCALLRMSLLVTQLLKLPLNFLVVPRALNTCGGEGPQAPPSVYTSQSKEDSFL